ncbi:sigma-70 family RNA polymerase sigma factor [Salinicoccus hispanicus]|uniref:Sigma-70 family RNA polymerase sigma factor n=1 Tax=Salinicoccus hispanicus TaxID=157225 RepID=A0A6N8U3C8_9STAP|nr:sigma-70 family RNA polymerase sigma factor [Salinicoccus hispanicus]MXQ50915.1 sigma-70 family RNA polymerase sigma factor [Salinicoccus hispanicus]
MNEKILGYEPMIYSIMAKLNIQFDQDDYMQVGRMAVYNALSTYDDIAAKGATESQFVYTRIYQRMIDEIRKVSRYTNAVSVTVDELLYESVGGRTDSLGMLELEGASLHLDAHELMWLSYTLKGYSVRELAELSGYSVSSVKNWRKSARGKLRKLFDES